MEVRDKLVFDAEKAVILLNKLTTPVLNNRSDEPDMVPMPKAILMASKVGSNSVQQLLCLQLVCRRQQVVSGKLKVRSLLFVFTGCRLWL